jgi:hypothetical protein
MSNRNPVLQAVALALLVVGVVTTQTAFAGDIPGAGDPALRAAIDAWLQDDDAQSLPAIAELARGGNLAARLLIARIEATDLAPGSYVAGLSRKQRVDLFRSSGSGLFRPTWLKTESSAGSELAAALQQATSLSVDLDAIRALYRLGESEAAYDLIREAAANGSQQQKDELVAFLPEDADLLPYVHALQNPVAGLTPGYAALKKMMIETGDAAGEDVFPGTEADSRAAATFVEFGYQSGLQASDFDRNNGYYDAIADWIQKAPLTTPVANLCRRYCGEGEVRSCGVIGFGLVGGYYKVIRFDTPLQNLVSQSDYYSSERALGMVLRRIAQVKTAAGTPMFDTNELARMSPCLADAVAGVRTAAN